MVTIWTPQLNLFPSVSAKYLTGGLMDTGFYHNPGEMGYEFHWACGITENMEIRNSEIN
jgi:hypothetical protein